jgi:DNA-binding XRE family transcriptional regulator
MLTSEMEERIVSMTGPELQNWRKTMSLTQGELAENLGVSRPTVSSLEATQGQIAKVYALAVMALKLNPNLLWRRSGNG